MNRKTVWLLLTEGFNVAEIAVAAKVAMPVAHAMVAEVMRARTGERPTPDTSEVLPAISPSTAGPSLKWMAGQSLTFAPTTGFGG